MAERSRHSTVFTAFLMDALSGKWDATVFSGSRRHWKRWLY